MDHRSLVSQLSTICKLKFQKNYLSLLYNNWAFYFYVVVASTENTANLVILLSSRKLALSDSLLCKGSHEFCG